MKNIAIVGSGIAGLQLGLFLLRHGIDATIYSDKSPDEIRASRLPNLVVRFDHTRGHERALGVEHWASRILGYSAFTCTSACSRLSFGRVP
jgi:2-polyprenyl-6-methoxyphenol hydroxylase-like FAD-dependent oxidoreductase